MKARYIIAIGVVLLFASWFLGTASYRNSHNQAKTIVALDQASQDVTARLAQLQTYVKRHMQSSVSLILSGSYQRAQTAAEVAANPQSSGQVYSQAQASCAGKADSITQAKCVQAYVASHSSANPNPQPLVMPKEADYTKTYLAPLWTPDLTGFIALAGWIALFSGLLIGISKKATRRR